MTDPVVEVCRKDPRCKWCIGGGASGGHVCGRCHGTGADPAAVAAIRQLIADEKAPLVNLMRDASAFAKYHEGQARFGGAPWEFHARAQTALENMAAVYRREQGEKP